MPSIDTDTRLVMTILFVGAVSGINIYFYSLYGYTFPYGAIEHGILFGISTIGGIMILKALFDMMLKDYIEEFLLQRRIDSYWSRRAREEDNRKRVRESFRSFQQQWNQTVVSPSNVYGDSNLPTLKAKEDGGVSPAFLTVEQ